MSDYLSDNYREHTRTSADSLAYWILIDVTDPAAHEDQLIPLTRNAISGLFAGLRQHLAAPAIQLHWSRWRRCHQAVARACHYRRRALAPT